MVSQRHVSVPRKRNAIIINSHKKRKKEGVQWQSPASQAIWFSGLVDSALGASLSQLEHTPPLSEESFIELGGDREASNISKQVKSMFREAWAGSLCKGEGDKEKGNPALLVLCSSATRCLELLKGLRCLTKVCKPAKLFAKHIKVEEQVKALEDYVNIAVGTPNSYIRLPSPPIMVILRSAKCALQPWIFSNCRTGCCSIILDQQDIRVFHQDFLSSSAFFPLRIVVKKLIDIGALGLGSLEIVLLDMHEDAKGFTLFTIPQVKSDLLELCRAHFHEHALTGKIKFCLY